MKLETFSNHFKLGKTQIELDFVNVLINKNYDLPLFIDPWAIKIRNDHIGDELYLLIQSYFELIIGLISDGKKEEALLLLEHSGELKEIKLGNGKGGYGKGIGGGKQTIDLYNALRNSNAVKRGNIKYIEETALMIDGINFDKVSDLVGNIILNYLINYTKEQCDLHNIKTFSRYGVSLWNGKKWADKYETKLPFIEGTGFVVLVPKSIVRKRSFDMNFDKFYNKYILEFEQAKHLSAGSGLCKILKSGKVKPPSKKDLKLIIPKNKETGLSYIENTPELLTQYKNALNEKRQDQDILKFLDPMVETNESEVIQKLIEKFSLIKKGIDNDLYHNHVLGCLLYIFYPNLESPKKEKTINNSRKKIDISMLNSAIKGFFSTLSKRNIACLRIYFECKNYTHDLKNPEYDQLLGRFTEGTSAVGFIVCRNITDQEKYFQSVKFAADKQKKYIACLTDDDLIKFMQRKLSRQTHRIDQFLTDHFIKLIEE